MSWATHQNPPRPSYPEEMLKHRFMPIGSLAPAPGKADSMDVDERSQNPAEAPQVEEEVKAKKRKVEGSTKKSKKSKKAE